MERTGGRAVRVAAMMVMAIVAGLVAAGLWLGRDQAGRDGIVKVNGWYDLGGNRPREPKAPEGYWTVEYEVTVRNMSIGDLPMSAKNVRVVLPVPTLNGKRMDAVRVDNILDVFEADFATRAKTIRCSCTPVSYPYEGIEITVDELQDGEGIKFAFYYFVKKGQENLISVPRSKTGDIVAYLEWEGLIADQDQTLRVDLSLFVYNKIETNYWGTYIAPTICMMICDSLPNYGPGWYIVNDTSELDWSEYLGPSLPENLFA